MRLPSTLTTPGCSSPQENNNADILASPLPVPTMNQPTQSYECSLKMCPLGHHSEVLSCFVPGCNKMVHWHCYERFVLIGTRKGTQRKEHFLPGDLSAVVCTRKHLKQAEALSKKAGSDENLGWTKDSLRGPDDPNNSENMLLDWLTTGNNYSKYRGGHNGQRKIQVCETIARSINAQGVKKERNKDMISKKICRLEKSYREASDWSNQTGQGVLETDPGGYHATLLRMCPHYDTLDPIMRDRANATCVVNSDLFDGVISTEQEAAGNQSDEDSYEHIIDEDNTNDEPTNSPPPSEASKEEEEQDNSSKEEEEQDNSSEEAVDEVVLDFLGASPPTVGNVAGTTTTSTVAHTTPIARLKTTGLAGADSGGKRKSTKQVGNKQAAKKKAPSAAAKPQVVWEQQLVSLESERWTKQQAKFDLEFKFELLKKYKELNQMGYDNEAIKKLVPEMASIIKQVGGEQDDSDSDSNSS